MTRISLSIILIGFGFWEIVQPSYWISFVPAQLGLSGSAITLVTLHGVVLLIVGLAILLGFYLRIAAVFAVLIMIEIIAVLILESGFTDLIIRDIVVLLIALALFFDNTRWMVLNKK